MEDQRYDRQSERGKAAGSQNRFWMGVLTGALVMAFVGLIIVGMSAGDLPVRTAGDQPAASARCSLYYGGTCKESGF